MKLTTAANPSSKTGTVTAWASYTATLTNMGTSPTQNLFWRQVGQNIEIMGTVTVGSSPPASEARIGLPGSNTADSTVLTLEPVGNWWMGYTGTNGHGGCLLAQPSTAYLTISNFQVFGSGTCNPIASELCSTNFVATNTIFLTNVSVKATGFTT